MSNFWLKLRIWTKTVLYVLLFLYALLFFFNNTADVTIWYWFGKSFTGATWWVMLFVFLGGAIAALLIRTIFKTIRQIRELKTRNQTNRMERELADMKSKAAMLHTKPATPPGTMVIDSAPPPGIEQDKEL
jgi:uncharacterized integral membrane protein